MSVLRLYLGSPEVDWLQCFLFLLFLCIQSMIISVRGSWFFNHYFLYWIEQHWLINNVVSSVTGKNILKMLYNRHTTQPEFCFLLFSRSDICIFGKLMLTTCAVSLQTPKILSVVCILISLCVLLVAKPPTWVACFSKRLNENWGHTPLERQLCLLTFGSWLKKHTQVINSWQCSLE